MARPALVVDASVGVKWFLRTGESDLAQALAIRDDHVAGRSGVVVPELFYYEVANALRHKPYMPTEAVQRSAQDLFDLGLEVVHADSQSMQVTVELARALGITVYDACYAALARERACPLATANPRHQGRDLGCDVISIGEWPLSQGRGRPR